MNRLDHNTLNYFRRDRLKDEINSFLVKWLFYLQGHGSLQTAFVDGTKIEARANRYTFVWAEQSSEVKIASSNNLKNFGNKQKKILLKS